MRARKTPPKPMFQGPFAGEQTSHFIAEMQCGKAGYRGLAEFHHDMIGLLQRKSEFYTKYTTRRARRDARKAGINYE